MTGDALHGKPDARWGWLLVGLGLYPLSIALGILDVAGNSASAPRWVIGACGVVFIVAGAMILGQPRSGTNDLLAALISFMFAAIAAWVSLFAPPAGFAGRIPFASPELNHVLARVVFGIGTVICVTIAIYALQRFRHTRRTD